MSTSTATATRRHVADPAETEGNERLWALVAQIQQHPAAAGPFGELYRLTHPAVFRFLRSRLDSHHDAEDLAADVYLRARPRIATLRRASGSPAAWLITIARNLLADHYKSSRHRVTVLVPEVAGGCPIGRLPGFEARDRTEADVDEIRVATALYGALTRLSREQREVLRLRYLLGESVAGAALAMGKQEGAIKALTYRAARSMARDPEVATIDGETRVRSVAPARNLQENHAR